ncbi:hypothetical protein [Bacteroides faecalis]|uniref:Uncharacterized protein n=1 Tax=Bacteroides faecalis TaxID=2447885 RepID=A0A401LWD3_9BACE|nr:hypothetical protein KGMB02408_27650 [Bacteroides faecalis]
MKHILKDSQAKVLQSDGYNVYMYLDDKLIDVEHLCCILHACTKFQYTYEQGGDVDMGFFSMRLSKVVGIYDNLLSLIIGVSNNKY